MKNFIFMILFAFVKADIIKTKPACTDTVVYEQEILRQGVYMPYQLAIDYDKNTLFFSYTTESTDKFKIAYLDLKTNDYGVVNGINGGFASAIDSKSYMVYMGGENGIYTFNYDTKSCTGLNIKPVVKIWQMFYKDGLYFTTYPDEKAFLYKNSEMVQITELKDGVMVLAVKNDGSYVYANSSGLFTYNKATDKALKIGDYIVNGITADIKGKIYFSTPTGIYSIDDQRDQIENLTTLEDVYGVAIEANGNIVYANEESIIRLKPVKGECLNNRIENNVAYLAGR